MDNNSSSESRQASLRIHPNEKRSLTRAAVAVVAEVVRMATIVLQIVAAIAEAVEGKGAEAREAAEMIIANRFFEAVLLLRAPTDCIATYGKTLIYQHHLHQQH